MRLSVQTDLALRVLIYLGVHPETRVRVQDIADAYAVSHSHLTKVVQQLQRSGYVKTQRGKGGGIELAESIEHISIGNVVRDFESSTYLVECFGPDNQCVIVSACKLKAAFADAYEAFLRSLDDYQLVDLVCGASTELRRLLAVNSS